MTQIPASGQSFLYTPLGGLIYSLDFKHYVSANEARVSISSGLIPLAQYYESL